MLKQFYKENKVMVQIFSVSCLVSISYLISNIFPETFMEWFTGADEIYSFFSDVSLAIIASVIFYYIQSFIPSYKRKIVFNNRIKTRCTRVLNEMITPINYMAKNYLPDRKWDAVYSEDELWEISKKIKFDDKVNILDPVTVEKWDTRQLIIEQISKVDFQVDKLFLYCEPYIEGEIVELLDKVLVCDYKTWMNNATRIKIRIDFQKTPKQNNYLIDYYNLYLELKRLVDKM